MAVVFMTRLLAKRLCAPPSSLPNGEGRPCGLEDRARTGASCDAPHDRPKLGAMRRTKKYRTGGGCPPSSGLPNPIADLQRRANLAPGTGELSRPRLPLSRSPAATVSSVPNVIPDSRRAIILACSSSVQ